MHYNYSTLGERLILGFEVTIIGMLIVFAVLALLSLIISLLSKILQRITKLPQKERGIDEDLNLTIDETKEYKPADKTGFVSGEALVIDADDEEVAAILAAVSFDTSIPLSELKIKSIKPVNR
ncbi:sodium pump decarboxylase subunit gamma [Caldicellulosiruptor changbaiensis]|uniref:Sodium pump decarboxylase subunit gamma n=1 Tax=Caldicellulosiruptor changbaiensis TaxID=1222016 RepID=A0A3T0D8V3_9FIRM|nr:OadG family transporter subunit [Caldicellulosiruptor changbaiensis]AZT91474.1 sodium pump decarboxylase subunit gamma [Caldicellulosiruptor changbaiensis]